jgi:hypothetical protein
MLASRPFGVRRIIHPRSKADDSQGTFVMTGEVLPTRLMGTRTIIMHEDALKKTEFMIKLSHSNVIIINQRAVKRSQSCSYET